MLSFEIQNRLPRIEAGETYQLMILGDFADEENVPLIGDCLTYTSSDPQVASVSNTGLAMGLSDGSSVITASRGNLQAATVATVGISGDIADMYLYIAGLNIYPETLTLSTDGGSRQFIVMTDDGTDLADGSTGTVYVVGDSDVIAVTEDGLVTALAPGETTLTIIHRPVEVVIPVDSAVPAGETVYFFQHRVLLNPNSDPQELWMLIDTGVVGDDGIARTTSPPYPGFSDGGQYLCAQWDSPEKKITFEFGISWFGGITGFHTAIDTFIGIGVPLMGMGGFGIAMPIPYIPLFEFDILSYRGDRPDTIPYAKQTVKVDIPEDRTTVRTEVTLPLPPVPAKPFITSISAEVLTGPTTVTIEGMAFTDTKLHFRMGLRDIEVTTSLQTDTSATATLPDGMILSLTDVYVVHPEGGESNPIRITPPGGLGFACTYGSGQYELAVFDAKNDTNTLIKQISLGGFAMDTMPTHDRSRVYVAMPSGRPRPGCSAV